MNSLTNEDLTTLNEKMKEYLGFDVEIVYEEENNQYVCECFVFKNLDDAEEWIIHFNDRIKTSSLIEISSFVIPILEELTESIFLIGECFYIKTLKNDDIEVLLESDYDKTFKKVKAAVKKE